MNDLVTPLDINTPNTVQKYNRIDRLELLVQTPLDQSGEIADLKGDAIINCGFLPHVHDMFLVELTGGRQAIFKIDTVEVKTYNLRDAYFISYSIFTFLDHNNNNIAIYNDLVYKTVNQYVYDKECLLDYSAPVIMSTDFKKRLNLKAEYNTLVKYYVKKFIDNDTKLFMLPTKGSKYYDSNISDFIFKIFDINTVPEMLSVSRVHDNIVKDDYSIWTSLVNRDKSLLSIANKNLFYRVVINSNNPILRSLGYLGINFILDNVPDSGIVPNISETVIEEDQPIKHTTNVTYVLSENFYKLDTTKTSEFEKLVIDFLNGDILDINKLENFITNYTKWSTVNQFYCLPILILLVRDAINNTFIRM